MHAFLTHSKLIKESMDRRVKETELKLQEKSGVLTCGILSFPGTSLSFHLGDLLLYFKARGFHDGCGVGRLPDGG